MSQLDLDSNGPKCTKTRNLAFGKKINLRKLTTCADQWSKTQYALNGSKLVTNERCCRDDYKYVFFLRYDYKFLSYKVQLDRDVTCPNFTTDKVKKIVVVS